MPPRAGNRVDPLPILRISRGKTYKGAARGAEGPRAHRRPRISRRSTAKAASSPSSRRMVRSAPARRGCRGGAGSGPSPARNRPAGRVGVGVLEIDPARRDPVAEHLGQIPRRHPDAPHPAAVFRLVVDPVLQMMPVAPLVVEPCGAVPLGPALGVIGAAVALIVPHPGPKFRRLYLDRSWQSPCRYSPARKQYFITSHRWRLIVARCPKKFIQSPPEKMRRRSAGGCNPIIGHPCPGCKRGKNQKPGRAYSAPRRVSHLLPLSRDGRAGSRRTGRTARCKGRC